MSKECVSEALSYLPRVGEDISAACTNCKVYVYNVSKEVSVQFISANLHFKLVRTTCMTCVCVWGMTYAFLACSRP